MKKYLIQLVKDDLVSDRCFLHSAKKVLEKSPEDEFWKRRQQSYFNKIEKKEKYLERLNAMPI